MIMFVECMDVKYKAILLVSFLKLTVYYSQPYIMQAKIRTSEIILTMILL